MKVLQVRFPFGGVAAGIGCVAIFGLGRPVVSQAAVILTTTADAAVSGPDGGGAGTAVNATNLPNGRAGSNNANNLGRAYIIPFQLPTLSAGQSFTSASFTVFYAAPGGVGGAIGTYPDGTNANFDADLYGLNERSSSTVLISDYYQGALDTTSGTSLLQHNFMTPGATPADTTAETTSAGGGTALAAYLNTEYALGGPGSWVFLRLNADGDASFKPSTGGSGATGNGYNYAYNYFTFDQGTVNGVSVIPAITYSTAVPEPASLGLTAVACVGLLRRRRAGK